MSDNWKQDRDDAAEDFTLIVWPAIRDEWFDGGQLVKTEDGSSVLADMFDQDAGIDAVVRDRNGIRTVAIRVQKDRAFDSFTIRAVRHTGVRTEREKRLAAMHSDHEMPALTLQAYVTSHGGALVQAGIVRTRDLYDYIEAGGRVERLVNPQDGNAFDVAWWADLTSAGVPIKVIRKTTKHYLETVTRFERNPLCPTDTEEDRWRRAGGREAAEAFANWTPHRTPTAEENE